MFALKDHCEGNGEIICKGRGVFCQARMALEVGIPDLGIGIRGIVSIGDQPPDSKLMRASP